MQVNRNSPVPKLTVRKHNGDDPLSWAVFAAGNPTPIVTGLSRDEARAEKGRIAQMYRERREGTR